MNGVLLASQAVFAGALLVLATLWVEAKRRQVPGA